MPIIPNRPLVRLSQEEFAPIAFKVMRCAFDLHCDFGRLFKERIYKRELARRMPGVELELPVCVTHGSFTKWYYLDVVVGDGALFEFKTVAQLVQCHKARGIHYLHLAGLQHAKLINMRPSSVEHEFVNTNSDHQSRRQFNLTTCHRFESTPGGLTLKQILVELLQDWGTGLELELYEEALTHFLGGESEVCRNVTVLNTGATSEQQPMRLAAPRSAFKLTALTEKRSSFLEHSRRMLAHLDLDAILWANITLEEVTLTTILA